MAAVTTEAVRKAANGGDFVARASAALAPVGGRMDVIDGEREARLSWRAVGSSFPSLVGPRTVVDIGGGSTELIVGEREVEGVISLPIGSVRLTERLVAHDPPTAEEAARLVETIDGELVRAPMPRGALVGIAGTVTTLSAMAQRLDSYDATRVHGARLGRADVDALVAMLGRTPLADKRRTPGLEPKRADVIFAGAVILQRVMARAGADVCIVSDRGIRWGLIDELAAKLTEVARPARRSRSVLGPQCCSSASRNRSRCTERFEMRRMFAADSRTGMVASGYCDPSCVIASRPSFMSVSSRTRHGRAIRAKRRLASPSERAATTR